MAAGTAIQLGRSTEQFCIPQNPLLKGLTLRAEANLHKLRTCRNIAGMERDLEPYAAPTDVASSMLSVGGHGQLSLPGTTSIQPTPYRSNVCSTVRKNSLYWPEASKAISSEPSNGTRRKPTSSPKHARTSTKVRLTSGSKTSNSTALKTRSISLSSSGRHPISRSQHTTNGSRRD